MKYFISILLIVGIGLAQNTLNGSGATFPFPIYSVWGYNYYKLNNTRLDYDAVGSSSGQRAIEARRANFGASDAPLQSKQLRDRKLVQFPAIIGAIVPIVNIPTIPQNALKLSPDVIADIFAGKIKSWNDPRILADNEDLNLPDEPITLVYRSDGSGTTAIFTQYLAESSSDFQNTIGAGKTVNWPEGFSARGNGGVSNYVKRVPFSIGYVAYDYAVKNRLSYVTLKNKAGQFVKPNIESFQAAASSANWSAENDFYLYLTNAPGENSWPITGVSFILLAEDQPAANRRVLQFFNWAFNEGKRTASKLSYVPLPDNLTAMIRQYWQERLNITFGSSTP